jgi:hypothetical protein
MTRRIKESTGMSAAGDESEAEKTGMMDEGKRRNAASSALGSLRTK